ncbi:flavodoxin [Aerococcus agrisoli]|uniref:Flavodoxin n=1 Tax=Aerococcus agrisoli TaxID=2487350 RepID=A0A3N4GHY0_9LACT|nr:flavodoxin [Aerococcus agrisoli]RPA62459.1 flavodoxin [Aerococcus agrisoli]
MSNSKDLIIYYSRSGNTQAVAELIQEKVAGRLVKLETAQARPSNYRAEVNQHVAEQNGHILPAFNIELPDLRGVDRIFLGTPTWNMALPQVIISFLRANDFSGKTIIPFNTNAGYGPGSTFRQIASEAKGANVVEGFTTQGGQEGKGIMLAIQGERKDAVVKELAVFLSKLEKNKF